MASGEGVFIIIQQKTITSDSYIKKPDNENTINSNSIIKKLGSEGSILSDMFIGYQDQTKTINSNSYIKKLDNENTINSDSYIKKLDNKKTITSDYYLKKPGSEGSIISDSYIKKPEDGKTINTNSQITYVGNTIITYPISGDKYIINDSDERITFIIPTSKSNIDIQLQLSKVENYATKVLDISSQQDTSIWEYYNGSDWLEWPSDGVPNTYSGNAGRVNIYGLVGLDDLTFSYLRMRGIIRS